MPMNTPPTRAQSNAGNQRTPASTPQAGRGGGQESQRRGRPPAARFESVGQAMEHQFGTNNWLKVERRRAVGEDGTSTDYIEVSRGYYDRSGGPKTKSRVTIPVNKEAVDFIADAIRNV